MSVATFLVRPPSRSAAGFTLLEVLFALTLFFMAVFAILDTTAQALRAARALERNVPEVGILAAELVLTNRLEEGFVSGDFGDVYPDFAWTRETVLIATNGLFQVDFTIQGNLAGRHYESTTSLYFWRPQSQTVIPGLRR